MALAFIRPSYSDKYYLCLVTLENEKCRNAISFGLREAAQKGKIFLTFDIIFCTLVFHFYAALLKGTSHSPFLYYMYIKISTDNEIGSKVPRAWNTKRIFLVDQEISSFRNFLSKQGSE